MAVQILLAKFLSDLLGDFEYYIDLKKQVVYGPTKDFFGVLDELKNRGPNHRMMRSDGEPLAFNPQSGIPTRIQYRRMRKDGSGGESDATDDGE